MAKQTNHICKNKNCPHGVNGEPKHYYACDYCDRSNQWRSLACCMECYDEYIQQVVDARSKNQEVDILPDRTDITKDEIKELLTEPIDEVMEKTKEDLKEYLTDGNTIADAIEEINTEINDADNNISNTVTNKTNSMNNYSKKNKRK